ncbi:MAG TPA: class I SAM-dependent methyltransferase [Ktedonobacteraceae bacterium]|nr:class I SAM-dependent methyltransferase [Ktedonobacteraceae bacterium]
MANQQEIEETYDFMDEIFRVSFGEHADLTCAMFNGDFSKMLAQAQRDKHEYILQGIGFKPGFRVLDIGSGFGPMLKARSGEGMPLA